MAHPPITEFPTQWYENRWNTRIHILLKGLKKGGRHQYDIMIRGAWKIFSDSKFLRKSVFIYRIYLSSYTKYQYTKHSYLSNQSPKRCSKICMKMQKVTVWGRIHKNCLSELCKNNGNSRRRLFSVYVEYIFLFKGSYVLQIALFPRDRATSYS